MSWAKSLTVAYFTLAWKSHIIFFNITKWQNRLEGFEQDSKTTLSYTSCGNSGWEKIFYSFRVWDARFWAMEDDSNPWGLLITSCPLSKRDVWHSSASRGLSVGRRDWLCSKSLRSACLSPFDCHAFAQSHLASSSEYSDPIDQNWDIDIE